MLPLNKRNNHTMLKAIFEETKHEVRCKNINGILWVCARDLANPLRITDKAVRF